MITRTRYEEKSPAPMTRAMSRMGDEPAASDPYAGMCRQLAEPFAFALVTWPAAFAAARVPPDAHPGWLVAALIVLAVFHLTAYGRGRGIGFGNVMLFGSGIVGLAAWGYPSPWCWGAFPLLLISLHGAQRALLRQAGLSVTPGARSHARGHGAEADPGALP